MTPQPVICAVVRDRAPGAAADATRRALAAQTLAPAVATWHQGSFHDALEQARRDAPQADWFWLLDAGVAPGPDALEQLVAATDPEGLPAPVLVAGKVVTPAGDIDEERAPWLPLLDRVVVAAAARRRLVSLRMLRWGSTLVSAAAIAEHGPPRADFDGGADDLEWSARLLRDDRGYLAPRSVGIDEAPPAVDPGLILRDRVRMLRSSAWVAHEPVWFAFMLLVDVGRRLRARPASLGGLAVAAVRARRPA